MRSTFSLRLCSDVSAMKLTARIMLKMKRMIPITRIVAIERNLFRNRFEMLSRKAFFVRTRGFEASMFFSY